MKENIILGIHTATKGWANPDVAKVVDTCINKIYTQLNTNPKAICRPTPPLILRDEIETPIIAGK